MSATVTDFVRDYRAHRDLIDKTRVMFAEVSTINDPDLLLPILQVLNVGPLSEASAGGQEFDAQQKTASEKLTFNLRRLAAAAQHRQALLTATKDPAFVRAVDFGRTNLIATNPASTKSAVVVGFLDSLPADHALTKALSGVHCPSHDGKLVAWLGRPVISFQGNFVPAPAYPLSQVVQWTTEAGRRQKEEIEALRQEEERKEAERRERNRALPSIEELRNVVATLAEQIKPLLAASAKSQKEHEIKEIASRFVERFGTTDQPPT